MSETSLRTLTEAIERLVISTDRLSSKIDQLLSRETDRQSHSMVDPVVPEESQGTSVPSSLQGVVKELQRVPFPEEFVSYCALWRFRGAEEGPGRAPTYCLDRASSLLSTKEPESKPELIRHIGVGIGHSLPRRLTPPTARRLCLQG